MADRESANGSSMRMLIVQGLANHRMREHQGFFESAGHQSSSCQRISRIAIGEIDPASRRNIALFAPQPRFFPQQLPAASRTVLGDEGKRGRAWSSKPEV